MTVLFLTRLFYPHIGGVEKHVLEIGKRLVKKGHEIIVVTEELSLSDIPIYQSRNTSAKSMAEVEGMQVYRIPAGGNNRIKKFTIWYWLWRHRRLIEQADIIHCHDVFFWYLPFRFLYPQKPVYTTFHGYETIFPPSKKAIAVRKLSEKLSNGNICVGEYIKKWYGTKPTFVTYGGVETKSQKSKVKSQKYNSKVKILFIGRLEEDLGIKIYLKTLDRLKERKIDYDITFFGEGAYKKEASKYGTVKVIHYNDIYYYSEVLQDADVVFASSYLAILEALAAQRLVFATYTNQLKEDYLKMSPFAKFIVIANDPKALAQKIVHYIHHPNKAEEICNSAFQWVQKQTWDQVASLYLKLWRI